MFEFFRQSPQFASISLFPPEWQFIKRGLQKNLEKTYAYYHLFCKPVKSEHFIVRLLNSISVPKTLALDRYYDNVDVIALNVAMTLGMTTSISKGSLFKGVFYGSGSSEVLIGTDSLFNVEYVNNNWKDASPITLLLTSKSDLGLHLPSGEKYSEEQGLSIFLINIPMLMVQYRAFLKSPEARNVDTYKTTAMFVGGYVIPNMLASQLDYSILNRLFNKFYGIKDQSNLVFRSHSFALSYYDSYVDKAIDKTLTNITKTDAKFESVLACMPMISNENAYDALMMPDMAPTRQLDWALVTARLKYLNLLFDLCGDFLVRRNNVHISKMLRAFRSNGCLAVMREVFGNDIYYEQDIYVNHIFDAASSNR